ncbi:MAG: BatA and WFA domain-containing protein, partial [Planctomycetota bacterium]|nr:BatA and WFA domain-containing protein [Planctomycetota bacterium]
MSLLHPVLLGLLGLTAVPVILHFLMRQKPKRLLFPALRLIETRRKTNVRRLRLRHIWLLLLRIAIIALLVIAIARPLVPAANYGLTTRELLTMAAVAVVCVFSYAAAVRWWGRRASANHVVLYRRSLLRAVTGAAAALLVLLLVAWPYARRVSAEVADPSRVLAEDRPVSAVFLFDTSRSMEYQFEGASRLEAAKRIALAHLSSLPSGSRVAVADSASQSPVIFQADLAGARERIEGIESQPLHTPLDEKTRAAFDLQTQDRNQGIDEQSAVPEELRRDPFVRAVYVFTDLAASAWSGPTAQTLRSRLETDKWLQLYLVDVGVDEPTNVGLTAIRPSDEVTTAGSLVQIRADLSAVGNTLKETAVELYVDGESGPVKQGQVTIKPEPGRGGRAEFLLPNVKPPLVQGELRLVRSDPFSADDVRRFTVAVEPAPKVLIVSDRSSEAFLWNAALQAGGYDVTRIASTRFGTTKL